MQEKMKQLKKGFEEYCAENNWSTRVEPRLLPEDKAWNFIKKEVIPTIIDAMLVEERDELKKKIQPILEEGFDFHEYKEKWWYLDKIVDQCCALQRDKEKKIKQNL